MDTPSNTCTESTRCRSRTRTVLGDGYRHSQVLQGVGMAPGFRSCGNTLASCFEP